MKLFCFLRNEEGSTIVIVTLLLVVVLGFVALVIDVGMIFTEKHKFQNAIDAAALAGAQDLPDTATSINSVNTYIQLNGYAPGDISISLSDSNSTINIAGTKKVNLVFAKILGFNEATISPSASASIQGGGSTVFDYAIFSGSTSKELIFNSKNIYIEGHTHTNDKLKANGEVITVTGRCEAVESLEINGQNINIPNKMPGEPFIEMPDFTELVKQQAKNLGTYYTGDKTFNAPNINLDHPIYVNGKVTINGSNFTGKGCIVAVGEIVINGENTDITTEDAICIYSKTDKITVNNENAKIRGILYAPNSKIVLNGKNQEINGRVVGKEVVLNGENQSVKAGSDTILNCLPIYRVKLTK